MLKQGEWATYRAEFHLEYSFSRLYDREESKKVFAYLRQPWLDLNGKLEQLRNVKLS